MLVATHFRSVHPNDVTKLEPSHLQLARLKPHRTLNTIVKDVILKGVVIVYDDFSPTRNRKAAIEKMLVTGKFIAKNGVTITKESMGRLETEYDRLVEFELSVKTGWRDLIAHPVKTYTKARQFKKSAVNLLDSAITASTKGQFQKCRDAQQHVENSIHKVHGAPTGGASDGYVNVPATHGNAVVPATSTLSTPSSTHLDPEAGGTSSPIAYIRFGDSDIRVGPNTRAKLNFDRDAFTMVLFPNHSPGPAAVSQPSGSARTATRTASVFTATGTARIISQPQRPKPDASSDESSQSDGDDLSVCMFEWLEGPVVTALTEDEGTTESASGSDTD
ncbi:hypothetical protein GSI_01653 [Ganoderma sinense ZZ0214-1]|uniref:Uncharacterized protein n=1 Tax=Ganoderma sinense ZZ0214-1 TaxID=1077348 RepID=A0A2G8SQJ8_9APHY|nr:hypothetical protein GSI_01653 [Ganoderma sinense ZZ0214-1]